MKTLSSFLIIFIFTITTLNSPAFSSNQSINSCNKIVCDANWQHVRFDRSYRLGPLGEDTLGIKLESTIDDHPCPRNAVLVKEDGLNPEYFRFTPGDGKDHPGPMEVETPFLISVVEKSGSCNETDRYLRVTGKNEQLMFLHVTGDGEVKTWSSCFRFVNFPLHGYDETDRYAPTYMLQLCPDKCGAADVGPVAGKCFRVGNVTKGEHVYLKLGGSPFEFALRGKDFGNLDAYV